jgi:hypothetical protein
MLSVQCAALYKHLPPSTPEAYLEHALSRLRLSRSVLEDVRGGVKASRAEQSPNHRTRTGAPLLISSCPEAHSLSDHVENPKRLGDDDEIANRVAIRLWYIYAIKYRCDPVLIRSSIGTY